MNDAENRAVAQLTDARTPMLARLVNAVLYGTGDVAMLRVLALGEQVALQRQRESN
jgi:hypothetical protein